MAAFGYIRNMSQHGTEQSSVIIPPVFSRRAGRHKQGASLGLTASNTAELIQQLERGLPFKAFDALESNSGVSGSLLASIIGIPERTLARRKSAGKLTPDESERLLRISTIFEKAVELHEGDTAAAVNWLTTPKKTLNHQSPLVYSRTELGAREVENLIGRLEHGIFS